MIQGYAEIMDRVAENGWDVFRHLCPKNDGPLPSVTVLLSATGAKVCVHVSPENRFQLTDVMFGPAEFEVRSVKVDSHVR